MKLGLFVHFKLRFLHLTQRCISLYIQVTKSKCANNKNLISGPKSYLIVTLKARASRICNKVFMSSVSIVYKKKYNVLETL